MIKEYFQQLRLLWTDPAGFFSSALPVSDRSVPFRFAVASGLLAALELGVAQALSKGSPGLVALVTLILLVAMPFVAMAWVFIWSGYVKLCGMLLGVDLPLEPLRIVTAFSTGGWAAMVLGSTLGKWVAMASFVFQVFGLEKALRCSRWTAVVYVGLPFSVVAVLTGIFTLIFKVFK